MQFISNATPGISRKRWIRANKTPCVRRLIQFGRKSVSALDDMNGRVFDQFVSVEDRAQLGRLVETLAVRYPAVPQVVIEHVVLDIHERFEDSRVRTFIPILIEKAARYELDALAQPGLGDQAARQGLVNLELIENEPLTGQAPQAEYS